MPRACTQVRAIEGHSCSARERLKSAGVDTVRAREALQTKRCDNIGHSVIEIRHTMRTWCFPSEGDLRINRILQPTSFKSFGLQDTPEKS